MGNIFDRKEVLRAIYSHKQEVRRKIFRITDNTLGHVVRVGNVVLTLIPYQKNKFVVAKISL
jgi:hypothetical protein